jgi:tripartite-type tricarboxylate transporter receptor subunit TctC
MKRCPLPTAVWTLAFTVVSAVSVPTVSAQAYPNRPIRLITPVAPGGPTDTAARVLVQKLGPLLGQTVVVDNRGGAGGTIGTEFAARAQPDGYTLLLASAGTFVTASLLNKNITYNIEKDFAAVTQVSVQPLLFVVHPTVPSNSVKEFISYARTRPGKLNYSSAGNATSGHLAAVVFNRLAGIEAVHVAYKGAAPGLMGLVAGEVQYQFSSTVSAKGSVETGRLKALAVAGERRSLVLPNVPTFDEAGLRYTAQTWTGIVLPAGTPPAIIKRLAGATHEAMASTEVQDQFAKTDTLAVVSTPAEFAALIARERRQWAEVIEKFKITL